MQVAERPARIGVSQSSGVVGMGSFSLMHWIVVLAIILILFGAGKLPRVMGDFAKGIKAFKAGMKEEEEAEATPPPRRLPNGRSSRSDRSRPTRLTLATKSTRKRRPRPPPRSFGSGATARRGLCGPGKGTEEARMRHFAG